MKVIKTYSYNTNNAWGFGGKIGTDTYYDNGMIYRKARNYHRHTGTSSASGWRVEGFCDEYPDFDIEVRGRKSDKVYIYQSGHSFRAFFQEKPNYSEYGEKWDLIKTIDLAE